MDESDRHLVRTGRCLEANALQALVDGVDGRILFLVDGLHVLFAADVGLEELLAVQRRDQVVVELHVGDPQRRRHVADIEFVFAVGGKVVGDDHTAARAQRQPFFVELLCACVLHAVLHTVGPARYFADSIHGDGAGRGQILIEE